MIDILLNFGIGIDWRQPLWLLLALQPVLLWLIFQWLKNRKQQQFADAHLLPWITVNKNKTLWQRIFSRDNAYFLAWIGFALALAGPRIPDENHQKPNDAKLDVMLVIDLSSSMSATDISPSRLRRATLETYEFLSLVKSARVGVVVYAARPHLFVPLTSDFKALEFYLKDLDSLQLPTQGSDSAAALAFAQKELQTSNNGKPQTIIWLTDGDLDITETNKIEALSQQQDINIHILGLGTPEGAAIPLKNGGWLESEGQAVITKSNFELLSESSKRWGGVFSIVQDNESDWEEIYYKGILADLPSAKNLDNPQWKELFAWFLFPAILLLLVALFPALKALLFFIGLSLFVAFSAVNAEAKDFLENIKEGVSIYEKQQFLSAKNVFIQAVLNANTEKQRAIALHNLGNAVFQSGDYANAALLFSDALRYAPNQSQSSSNQQLTIALYNILEKRRKRNQAQGNFAVPNQNSPLFDLPDQLPFMLNTKAVNLLEFSLPELPNRNLNRLLETGIEHIQLLQGSGDTKQIQEQQEHQQNVAQASIHLMGLEEPDSKTTNQLWKRLFEIEEGFPGSLDEPEVVPGVRPW